MENDGSEICSSCLGTGDCGCGGSGLIEDNYELKNCPGCEGFENGRCKQCRGFGRHYPEPSLATKVYERLIDLKDNVRKAFHPEHEIER